MSANGQRDIVEDEPVILDIEEQEDEDEDEIALDAPASDAPADEPEDDGEVDDSVDVAEIERAMRGIGRADMDVTGRVVALVAEFRRLRKENARLATEAAMGRQYREDLIQETLATGVGAQGAGFPVEQYRTLLASADIDAIKAVRDGFAEARAARLPVGRQSSNGSAPAYREDNEIPAAAFSG